MITSFHVENYKALRDVKLDLTPMHVLIGPNDSGKTSILEALAALCRSVTSPLEDAFAGPWTGRELVWYGSREPVVTLGVQFDSTSALHSYGFSCRFGNTERTVRLISERGTTREDVVVEFQSANFDRTQVARINRDNEGASTDLMAASSVVCDLLQGPQTYRWVPKQLGLPVAPDVKRRFQMESTGFGLALCLDDILSYDRDRFGELERRFQSVFPQVKSLKLIQESAYKAPIDNRSQVLMLQRSDGKGLFFQFSGSAEIVPASQVSDGLLLVLAYLTILYLPEPPRVLLIEEPENGIHPARLEQVLGILRDLVREQSRTQVVLTTHSPYVVDQFRPDEVTLCSKEPDGAVRVRRLSESRTVREQMKVFTLGEIWTGEGDDILMEKAIDEIVPEPVK
ncbi:MAG: AAA family ATPase [Planctomycetaceae bacterium]